jgi:hypothetical protein
MVFWLRKKFGKEGENTEGLMLICCKTRAEITNSDTSVPCNTTFSTYFFKKKLNFT